MHTYKKIAILCATLALSSFVVYKINTTGEEIQVIQKYQAPASELLLELPEKSAVSMGGVLLGKPPDTQPSPTASTAKMILALMIREQKPFPENEVGETLQVNQATTVLHEQCMENGGSCSPVEPHGEFSEYDALATTLIISSNNMADTLAVWAFGSLENYQTYANQKLKSWGILNTFVGPDASGFDPATTSTPSDLVKIGEKFMEDPVLRKIVFAEEISVAMVGPLINLNRFVSSDGTVSIKTGWIGETSGYNLVAASEHLGEQIVVAVMARPTRIDATIDALTILEKTKESISSHTIVSADQEIGQLNTWWTESIPIVAEADLEVVNKGTFEVWQSEIEIAASPGQPVGSVGHLIFTSPITNKQHRIPAKIQLPIPKPSLWEKLTK